MTPVGTNDFFPDHLGIQNDNKIREANLEAGLPLCEHCGGTGNEFYAMYRACTECGGSGTEGGFNA